jgi:hypothetical protein
MKDSTAKVKFMDGAEMIIEPESLVILEKTPAEDTDLYKKIVLKLFHGSLEKKEKGELPFTVEVPGMGAKGRIEDETGAALFRLASTNEGVSVRVQKGAVRVGDQRVTESQQATVKADGHIEIAPVPTEPPPPPAIAPQNDGPDDGDSIVAGEHVKFRWKLDESASAAKASIVLELSETRDFAAVEAKRFSGGSRDYDERYIRPREIFWRVRADYGGKVGISEPSAARRVLVKPRPLLKAPKIRKLKIRIEPETIREPARPPRGALWARWLREALFSRAWAAGPERKVTVELEWDKVEGAEQYHVQIAADPKFATVLVDTKLKDTSFEYKTTQTTTARIVYFRVAGIDDLGNEGEFSDANEVPIAALPPPKPKSPVVPKPVPPVEKTVEKPVEKPVEKKKPPVADAYAPTREELDRRDSLRIDLMAGAAYQSRTFKSSAAPTQAVGGAALLPAFGGLEIRKGLGWSKDAPADEPPPFVLDIGANAIAEKAEPTTPNVFVEKLPMPYVRAWMMLEMESALGSAGAGLYGATSQKISWNARHVVNERTILLGISGELMSARLERRSWFWRVQVGLLGAGGIGADVALSARLPLFPGGPARQLDWRGFFVEGEGLGRVMNIEQSYGGVVKLGYSF